MVTLVATLPLAAMGLLALWVNTDTLETTQRELQIAVLEDLARVIDDELADAETGLDAVGRVLSEVELDPDARVALAKSIVEARISLDHAAIYDREGALIDVIRERGTDTSALPERLSEAELQALGEARSATGEALPASAGELAPRVPILVAIAPEGPDGPRTGFVLAHVSLAGAQDRVVHLAATHFGDGQDTLYVVDRKLRVLAHVDGERARSLAPVDPDTGALAGIDPAALSPMVARSTARPTRPTARRWSGP